MWPHRQQPTRLCHGEGHGGPILFLTRSWLAFQRQQNKTTSHTVGSYTWEMILTSKNDLNQRTGAWWEHNQNHYPGRSSAEAPLPYLTINSKVSKLSSGNLLHQCFWIPTLLPWKFDQNPRSILETLMQGVPPVSLPIDLTTNLFLFLKACTIACHSTYFYFHRATNSLLCNTCRQWNIIQCCKEISYLNHEKTWAKLRCIFLNKRSQSEKTTYCMIPYIWCFEKGKIMGAVKGSVIARG